MLKPSGLDRAALRRIFNHKLTAEDRADFMLMEVERRLDERLDPMRLDDAVCVLDLGCGLGRSMPLLARRFPKAQIVAVDQAEVPLMVQHRLAEQARKGVRGLLHRFSVREQMQPPVWVAADAHRLPLAANSVDVVWANLVFHWFDDPLAVLAECYRVLRPTGVLLMSAFGVDTCRELQAGGKTRDGGESARAPVPGTGLSMGQGEYPSPPVIQPGHDPVPFSGVMAPSGAGNQAGMPGGAGADTCDSGLLPAGYGLWPAFQDMHDWGDAMMECGFVSPVMDVEHIQLSHQSAEAQQADLAALGFPHPADRFEPVLGFELIFGHAWVPETKARADGLTPINIIRRGLKT